MPGVALNWNHKEYLEKRRYDPDYIETVYGVKGTDWTHRYGARIYVPIIFKNELVSYQGRYIGSNPDALRYITAKPENERRFHKHILYNFDNCRGDRIVLVEGIFDAWRLGAGACATFGTSFMDEQLLLLKPFRRVYFLYDSEPEAQAKAKKAVQTIQPLLNGKAYLVDLGTGGDPDDLTQNDAE